MADFNGPQATPNVGIRGSTEVVEPLKAQVKEESQVGNADYSSAFDSLANTKSSLGTISSSMMVNSSNQLAELWGTELGNNPHGDIIPAITEFDKNFEKAYSTQSAAILGNQATSMMNQAEEELNKNFKITPESLGQYNQSMLQGAQKIFSNAPSSIKPKLESAFSESLLSTYRNYTMKMQTQNKEEAQSNIVVSNTKQIKDLLDNTISGTANNKSLSDFKEELKQQREARIITPEGEYSYYEAAKTNYYSGQEIRGAIFAKTAQNLPQYLRDMPDKLSNDLSPNDTLAVTENVLNFMKKIQSTESQDNQLIISELTRAKYENRLTGEMLIDAEAKLPPHEFNDFMSNFYSHQSKVNKTQDSVNGLASNFQNIYAFADAKPEQINGAFQALTLREAQKKPGSDIFQVQTGIAKGAGAEVPIFTKTLDAMLKKGGVNEANSATNAVGSFLENPNTASNIHSLSKEARAISGLFKDLTSVGVPAEQALQTAREQVLKPDEFIDAKWKQYKNDKLSTADKISSKTRSLLDTSLHWYSRKPSEATIANFPLVANKAMNVLESNFRIVKDADVAEQMTKEQLTRVYGETSVNGKTQIEYLGIEHMAGIGADHPVVVHQDIVRNLHPQLEATREAFKDGKIEYFYNIYQDTEGSPRIERIWKGSKYEKPNLKPPGLIAEANYDLTNLKKLKNENGSESTVSTATIEMDGKTFLIPTVIDGKRLSNEEAISEFKKNHKYLGIFKSERDANLYDEALHNKMGWIGSENAWPKYPTEGLRENFKLQVAASPMLQLSNNPVNPVSGYYDVTMVDDNGNVYPMNTISTGNVHSFGYRPDLQRIKRDYNNIFNSSGNPIEDAKRRAEDFVQNNNRLPSYIDPARFSELPEVPYLSEIPNAPLFSELPEVPYLSEIPEIEPALAKQRAVEYVDHLHDKFSKQYAEYVRKHGLKSSIPSVPEFRKESSIPSVPEFRKESSIPSVPEFRKESSIPSVPEFRKESSIPSVPEFRKESSIPSVPEFRKESSIPKIPMLPEIKKIVNDKALSYIPNLNKYATVFNLIKELNPKVSNKQLKSYIEAIPILFPETNKENMIQAYMMVMETFSNISESVKYKISDLMKMFIYDESIKRKKFKDPKEEVVYMLSQLKDNPNPEDLKYLESIVLKNYPYLKNVKHEELIKAIFLFSKARVIQAHRNKYAS